MGALNMLAEGATVVEPTVISQTDVTTATSLIFGVVAQTLNEIVSNPVFLVFFVSGLVFMATRIIRNLKRV